MTGPPILKVRSSKTPPPLQETRTEGRPPCTLHPHTTRMSGCCRRQLHCLVTFSRTPSLVTVNIIVGSDCMKVLKINLHFLVSSLLTLVAWMVDLPPETAGDFKLMFTTLAGPRNLNVWNMMIVSGNIENSSLFLSSTVTSVLLYFQFSLSHTHTSPSHSQFSHTQSLALFCCLFLCVCTSVCVREKEGTDWMRTSMAVVMFT